MEGAIVFFILILICILLIPLFIVNSINGKLRDIQGEIKLIKGFLKQLNGVDQYSKPTYAKKREEAEKPSISQQPTSPLHDETPRTAPQSSPLTTQEEKQTTNPVDEVKKEPSQQIESKIFIQKNILDEVPILEVNSSTTEKPNTEQVHQPITEKVTPPPIPKLETKYFVPKTKTNFEQFIGEKLISIVGIAILVLGIFFTVKWAIDKHLINDAGKVLIGLISGTILIATAHKLSKNYRAFSSILAGGGIAVLYFSIYEAFQAYHLFSQTVAFGLMILITILAVILSIFYDKKELSIIAIIGGFATPFFVSTGSGNYQVLFSYLLVLNIGMFALAYFKKWNLINIICYVLTMIIFGSWIALNYNIKLGHNHGGFIFATLFFLVFFGMNIIYNLRYKTKFAALEIGLLLSNSFIYLGLGLFFLKSIQDSSYQGIFTISLAIFNFMFAYIFFKRKAVDKNLIYLLIGLVLTFLSLTGPIQLEGNYITLFWACEMVILYWLGIKSNIPIIKNSSVVILLLTIISLAMDWQNNYFLVHINKYPFFFNKAFITGAIVIAALILKRKFIKADTEQQLCWGTLPIQFYRYATEIILLVIIYLVGFLELQYQTEHTYGIIEFSNVIHWAYQYIFIAAILIYSLRKKTFKLQRIITIISAMLLFLYMAANVAIAQLRDIYLLNNVVGKLYAWHYLIPIFALGNIALLVYFIRNNYSKTSRIFEYAAWFLTAAFIYIISSEIIHSWVTFLYEPGFSTNDSKAKAIKIALPILWSVCSLSLMIIGMRRKIKTLRIISLSLFTITILKLFIYDISNVSQGGKIAAFIILGVILLLVSFMYQKIKGLFIEEEETNSPTQHNSSI